MNILDSLTKSGMVKTLLLSLVLSNVGKLPSALESALTVKDSDVNDVCKKSGIKKPENIRKVRAAFRAFAKAGGNVLMVITDARADEINE